MTQAIANESLNETLETGSQIADRIDAIVSEIIKEFKPIPANEFFQSPPAGWSPALNLKHLNKAALPISLTLALPKVSLFPMGKSDTARSYKQIRDTYLGTLGKGAGAGVFTPAQISGGSEEKKNALIEKFKNTHAAFTQRIRNWSEADLMRYRMPHPIIGMLSVKEMLFFATYHLGHHASKVLGRRA